MSVLYFFESIRNPVLDFLAANITRCGEEIIPILLCAFILWCVNKEEGRYLLTVTLLGIGINQLIKIAARIPRPWVQDPEFTIVESARARATGYSFPSGHTQNAIDVYGGLFLWHKNQWIRIVCMLLCILVLCSRMYLGVHTVYDVGVAAVLGLVIIHVVFPAFRKKDEKGISMVFAAAIVFGLIASLYVHVFPFPEDIDPENLMEARKNLGSYMGALLGLITGMEIDRKWVHYETEASLPGQILKLMIGMVLLVAVMLLSRTLFVAILGRNYLSYLLRYYVIILYAAGLWPMSFPFFSKIRQ